jgi:hypothetical protein
LRNCAITVILVLVKRREYDIEPITVNKTVIKKVLIDPHYEERHSDHMNDQLILQLVAKLDGRIEVPEVVDEGFNYFATLLGLKGRQYRLIWLLEPEAIYVGVVNAYRDDRSE